MAAAILAGILPTILVIVAASGQQIPPEELVLVDSGPHLSPQPGHLQQQQGVPQMQPGDNELPRNDMGMQEKLEDEGEEEEEEEEEDADASPRVSSARVGADEEGLEQLLAKLTEVIEDAKKWGSKTSEAGGEGGGGGGGKGGEMAPRSGNATPADIIML